MSGLSSPLLRISNLHIGFRNSPQSLVHGVDFSIEAGSCYAIVGESGCGKSLTAMSIAGLLPKGLIVQSGEISFASQALQNIPESHWRKLRGNDIGVIFQNPLTSFNPVMRIGEQIAEVLICHKSISSKQARLAAVGLLERMGVVQAELRSKQFPHEFSGGMLQRAMIAMAVACKPRLLIADEPTTALDVTIQSQVLALLRELQKEQNMALLLITHDLAVVAEMAHQVGVMYAGRFVEKGATQQLLSQPQHPYTQALKSSLPVLSDVNKSTDYIPLHTLKGTPPNPSTVFNGCPLTPRCKYAMNLCENTALKWFGSNERGNSCWLSDETVRERRGL